MARCPGRLSAGRCAGFSCVVAAAAAPAAARRLRRVDRIVGELGRISGFRLGAASIATSSAATTSTSSSNERVKEVATPEEIRAEELTLKKFGLVPAGFRPGAHHRRSAHRTGRGLLRFPQEKLFITDTTPSATQRSRRWCTNWPTPWPTSSSTWTATSSRARKSDDGALARMAVMEGQATWLMSEYLARRMGQSLGTSPALVAMP